MRSSIRRGRAAAFLAAAWATLWGALGLVVGLGICAASSPYPVFPDVGQWWLEWHDVVLRVARAWAVSGAVAGLAFAAVLAKAERGRTAGELSGRRTALWGGVAGAGLVLLNLAWLQTGRPIGARTPPRGIPAVTVVTLLTVGAACAWLTLALTRRAVASSVADERPGGAGGGAAELGAGELPLPESRANASVRPASDSIIEREDRQRCRSTTSRS